MRFEVKALHAKEGVVALALDAADESDASNQARTRGYTVLAVRRQALVQPRARRLRFPLLFFSQELLALLDAGLSLVEAIETLTEKEHRPENKKTLNGVIERLYEGQPLSQALTFFPQAFPALYIASVRASERTGDLQESLTRFIGYQTQMDVVRKKLVSASIYPAVLLIVGGLVTMFLLGYVVPKFSHIYEDLGTDLPLASRLLLRWGQLIEAHGSAVLAALIATIALLGIGATRPEVRRWIGERLWRIPAVGERMRIYQLARFFRTLGMLLRGGIPVVTALDMASGLLHPTFRARLANAAQHIREGQSISKAMEAHALTTPVAVRMLRVGERTGKMGEMMERIAKFYDDEMERWVDWFTKLFEPLLMVFIGLIIGVVVLLMYFPIFELAGSIQ